MMAMHSLNPEVLLNPQAAALTVASGSCVEREVDKQNKNKNCQGISLLHVSFCAPVSTADLCSIIHYSRQNKCLMFHKKQSSKWCLKICRANHLWMVTYSIPKEQLNYVADSYLNKCQPDYLTWLYSLLIMFWSVFLKCFVFTSSKWHLSIEIKFAMMVFYFMLLLNSFSILLIRLTFTKKWSTDIFINICY